jgi:hypothetical protein
MHTNWTWGKCITISVVSFFLFHLFLIVVSGEVCVCVCVCVCGGRGVVRFVRVSPHRLQLLNPHLGDIIFAVVVTWGGAAFQVIQNTFHLNLPSLLRHGNLLFPTLTFDSALLYQWWIENKKLFHVTDLFDSLTKWMFFVCFYFRHCLFPSCLQA